MSGFQILGLGMALAFIALNLWNLLRSPQSRGSSIAWIAVWCVGAAALLDPGATTRVARALGIRRGADLLVYCSALAGLAAFFFVMLRLRRIDRDITVMVRRMAIDHAEPPEGVEESP